jgi:hypothetical protein
MTMDAAERHALVRRLFDEALTLGPAEQRRFVEAHTPDHPSVRAEVLTLLGARADPQFMAAPMVQPRTGGTDKLGIQVDRYTLTREIGRGGMGIVYLAVRSDDVFHKVVALKVIGAGIVDAAFVERFKKERQILAGLDHPNIARILDGGDTSDGRPFYVMEYVAGSPIDEHCARVRADVQERVRLIIQICNAVDYLHEHAIIHRDLKPSNILVTANGQVKLLDFGIARVQTVDGLMAPDGPPDQRTMLLTPGYASPEQVQGREITKRSDVYSIGAVLYELLTGRLPYADTDGKADLAAQLTGNDPPAPSRVTTERDSGTGRKSPTTIRRFTADLDQVVLTALRRDAGRRHPTVRTFGEELSRVLEGRPLQLRSDNWTYSLSHLLGQHRVAAVLVVLLLLAVALIGVFAVQARMDRVRVEAAQAELDRLVGLVGTLNGRVEQWAEPGRVSTEQKVADVERASLILGSKALNDVVLTGGVATRTDPVVTGIRRFLDRADELSADETPVRKSIAVTYKRVGDFEAKAVRPKASDSGAAAVGCYQRAATIAASVPDKAWADAELSDLTARASQLGATLTFAAAEPEPEPVPVTAPTPVRSVRTAPSPPAEAAPAGEPVPEAVLTRLETTAKLVENARKNVEALRVRLESQGQILRPEIAVTMAQVEGYIDQARLDVGRRDAAGVDSNLNRAIYTLRRVTDAVGR